MNDEIRANELRELHDQHDLLVAVKLWQERHDEDLIEEFIRVVEKNRVLSAALADR